MNENEIKFALNKYHTACNDLLMLFCQKHEFDYEDAKDSWVSNEIGGTACCGDYYFNMDVILTDFTKDAPEEELIKWYDYCVRCAYLGVTSCNYRSWLKGCPTLSEVDFRKLEEAKERVDNAEREFKKLLKEYK